MGVGIDKKKKLKVNATVRHGSMNCWNGKLTQSGKNLPVGVSRHTRIRQHVCPFPTCWTPRHACLCSCTTKAAVYFRGCFFFMPKLASVHSSVQHILRERTCAQEGFCCSLNTLTTAESGSMSLEIKFPLVVGKRKESGIKDFKAKTDNLKVWRLFKCVR